MKANELMIGNAVKVHGHPKCRVIGVNHGEVVTLWSETADDEMECFERVCPIPITEEWLTKNGFKREYDCICEFTYYIREIDGYFVEVKIGCSNMGDEYVNCHIDNCDRNSVANADIQYVHQLQNLLNIMNIKFDIEL